MQNIDLICVGKLNAPYFAAGVAEYQKRLGAFCNFRIIELPEAAIADKTPVTPKSVKLWTKRQPPFFPACAKGNISPHFAWKVNNFPVKSWQN